MPSINVPGVGVVNFPDTMSQEQIIRAIETEILPNAPRQEVAKPETGFLAGIKSGARSLLGDIGAIGVATNVPGAEQFAAEQRQKAAQAVPELCKAFPQD